jgi:hypothetical protein
VLRQDRHKKSKKLCEQVYDQFEGIFILDNADKSKFDSILTGLNTQHSLLNDQCPKSITVANNVVLSNERFNTTPKVSGKQGKMQGDNNKIKDQKSEGKEDEGVNILFAQMEGKCYCCGKGEHKSQSCCDKGKPKEEWAINKA